jgi:hypothetical protein
MRTADLRKLARNLQQAAHWLDHLADELERVEREKPRRGLPRNSPTAAAH